VTDRVHSDKLEPAVSFGDHASATRADTPSADFAAPGGLPSMETIQLDLGPQAAEVASVVAGIRDDQLGDPTPCADTPVAGLLAHLAGLCDGVPDAAEKTPVPGDRRRRPTTCRRTGAPGSPTSSTRWLRAWRRPSAWEGTATAGGVTMPAQVAGIVALDEVLVHGWDLAVATGQDYTADPAAVAGVHGVRRAGRRRGTHTGVVRPAGTRAGRRPAAGPAAGSHRPRPGMAPDVLTVVRTPFRDRADPEPPRSSMTWISSVNCRSVPDQNSSSTRGTRPPRRSGRGRG
jgi:uncharacterized protein (TIGR03086 family)